MSEGIVFQQSFSAGEIIFNEGDPGNCAYVIVSGKVEICREIDGALSAISLIHEQGIFGEIALVDGLPRSAMARAKNDATCMVIDKDKFDAIFQKSHPFLKGLISHFRFSGFLGLRSGGS